MGFPKRRKKVYDVLLEGTENTVTTLKPILEQSWSLDPKFPRQY